jgi:hypothetical protein
MIRSGVFLPAGEAIHRYEVPVDGQWHELKLAGDPLHIGCRSVEVVELWAVADLPRPNLTTRAFQVVGTGQPIPDRARYWGSVVKGPLVWHLIERWPPS